MKILLLLTLFSTNIYGTEILLRKNEYSHLCEINPGITTITYLNQEVEVKQG